jgi:hypothetical protein
MGHVVIGMDPHKRPATIEITGCAQKVLSAGRFGTDRAGTAAKYRNGGHASWHRCSGRALPLASAGMACEFRDSEGSLTRENAPSSGRVTFDAVAGVRPGRGAQDAVCR